MNRLRAPRIYTTVSRGYGYTYSAYHSPVLEPNQSVQYRFRIEARDVAGNLGISPERTLWMIGGDPQLTTTQIPCGPPTGNGGCLPN
jgi:hypothetical protein